MTSLIAGIARGRKYTTKTPENATSSPVNFSNHVWKYAAVISNIHHDSPATTNGALTPPCASFPPSPPSSLPTTTAPASLSALPTLPSLPKTIRSSLSPAYRITTGNISIHKNPLPSTRRNTCPLISCPPFHWPPASLHAALVKNSFVSPICALTSSSLMISQAPPVSRNPRSISGGPKNHCVTTAHHTVTNAHLSIPLTRLGVSTRLRDGPVE